MESRAASARASGPPHSSGTTNREGMGAEISFSEGARNYCKMWPLLLRDNGEQNVRRFSVYGLVIITERRFFFNSRERYIIYVNFS